MIRRQRARAGGSSSSVSVCFADDRRHARRVALDETASVGAGDQQALRCVSSPFRSQRFGSYPDVPPEVPRVAVQLLSTKAIKRAPKTIFLHALLLRCLSGGYFTPRIRHHGGRLPAALIVSPCCVSGRLLRPSCISHWTLGLKASPGETGWRPTNQVPRAALTSRGLRLHFIDANQSRAPGRRVAWHRDPPAEPPPRRD